MNTIVATSILDIIETLNYDAIYEKRKASFVALWPENEQQKWRDVLELESEPVVKLLQESAYLELLLRARINDVARSNLLTSARNNDLNNLALFYGVERLAHESDEDFRNRIRERIRASSTAGPKAHYRYHALSADPTVADVHIDSTRPGLVNIAIIAKNEQNELIAANEALIEKVKAHLTQEHIKVLTDTLEIKGATVRRIDIEANVWLLPQASLQTLEEIKAHLRQQAKKEMQLGRSLTQSWLIKTLHTDNVERIALIQPQSDLNIAHNEAFDIGQITLHLMGHNHE
ncbi:baseplate assembly protein [Histophilus somni]|uniref:baseplate assembly protein n=1 Tax=Histophilus somni TaxID=731 RepID=UPI00201FA278|nr:baseplate J/gp47 family protein [Histophilus somni]